MITRPSIVIMALFYFSWFGCALIAVTDSAPYSIVFPAVLIGYILWSDQLRMREIPKALVIAGVGVFADSLALNASLIKIHGSFDHLIPVWLISLWLSFSLSMLAVGKMLNISTKVAAILGFIMGPLSYKSGEFLKVIEFQNLISYIVYAIFWGAYFPLILHFSKRAK